MTDADAKQSQEDRLSEDQKALIEAEAEEERLLKRQQEIEAKLIQKDKELEEKERRLRDTRRSVETKEEELAEKEVHIKMAEGREVAEGMGQVSNRNIELLRDKVSMYEKRLAQKEAMLEEATRKEAELLDRDKGLIEELGRKDMLLAKRTRGQGADD